MIKNQRVTGTHCALGGETGVYSSQDLWLSGRNLLRRARHVIRIHKITARTSRAMPSCCIASPQFQPVRLCATKIRSVEIYSARSYSVSLKIEEESTHGLRAAIISLWKKVICGIHVWGCAASYKSLLFYWQR